jgi:hypothetical protein
MPPLTHRTYTPHKLLSSSNASTTQKPSRILIILNAPITSLDLVRRLWQSCAVRICADGGANRLYDFLREESERRDGVVVEGVGWAEELVSFGIYFSFFIFFFLSFFLPFLFLFCSVLARGSEVRRAMIVFLVEYALYRESELSCDERCDTGGLWDRL